MAFNEDDINAILSLPKHIVNHMGRTQSAISWHDRYERRDEIANKKRENDMLNASIKQYAETITQQEKNLVIRFMQNQAEEKISSLNSAVTMAIRKFMEMSEIQDINSNLVLKLRKLGFEYTDCKMSIYRYKGMVLTSQDIEQLLSMPTEVLMNMNKLGSAIKEQDRLITLAIKKAQEKRELEAQLAVKAKPEVKIDEDKLAEEKSRRRERYEKRQEKLHNTPEYQQSILYKTEGSAIWKQVDIIFEELVAKCSVKDMPASERVYLFNELDFLMQNSEPIDELIKCADHRTAVAGYRAVKKNSEDVKNWHMVVDFLRSAKKYSVDGPIVSRIEFNRDGKLVKPTPEQEEATKQYLAEHNLPINDLIYFYALRRLVTGGDLNSKFDAEYLNAENHAQTDTQ